jgi:predicted transcriptional regulator of viral defense system
MKTKSPLTRTLGSVSARFINALQMRGKTVFTLDEASNIYGRKRQETINFLVDLVKRGVLARIKSGVYLLLKTGQENTQLSNWPLISRELVAPNSYFISYYSAMRLHGMTTHPLLDVFITMSKRRMTKKISNITYHFVYSKREHFWGKCNLWISKQDKVSVSDIERTLLDGFARPELCGGIKEVVRGLLIKQKEIDWKKMFQYAAKFQTKAAVKRLGFIIEMLNITVDGVPLLAKKLASAKDYVLLDPNGPKVGKRISRWHIRVNINVEELKASVWG